MNRAHSLAVLVIRQASEPFQMLIPRKPYDTRLLCALQRLKPEKMTPVRSTEQNSFKITEVTVAFSNLFHFAHQQQWIFFE